MAGAPATPSNAGTGRQAALREHALRSLLELGRELSVSHDLYGTADLLLFNAMGQLGTSRAALWLLAEAPRAAVLVRAHGFEPQLIAAAGAALAEPLAAEFGRTLEPVSAARLASHDTAVRAVLDHAGVALFAPVVASGRATGWLALGERLGAHAYGPDDLEVLNACCGVAGSALENTQLYQRLLERHRELQSLNERLAELDRLKRQFLDNISHELRTPLAVAIGALECLTGAPLDETRARRLLDAALGKSRELQVLIDNVLRFSDEAAARIPVRIEVAELGPVLAAWCADRQPGVGAGLRELRLVPHDALPAARFDRERLLQILDELLNNAVKFTPRGSHLWIEAVPVGQGAERGIDVRVCDDGPGIAPERMASLFRSFEQGDGAMTRSVGGMGMGLALAHQLASRMGCRLDASSAPQRGSVFTVRVPAA